MTTHCTSYRKSTIPRRNPSNTTILPLAASARQSSTIEQFSGFDRSLYCSIALLSSIDPLKMFHIFDLDRKACESRETGPWISVLLTNNESSRRHPAILVVFLSNCTFRGSEIEKTMRVSRARARFISRSRREQVRSL